MNGLLGNPLALGAVVIAITEVINRLSERFKLAFVQGDVLVVVAVVVGAALGYVALGIPGIGVGIVAALAAVGVHTVAQATGTQTPAPPVAPSSSVGSKP
jgi:hypothetical protein